MHYACFILNTRTADVLQWKGFMSQAGPSQPHLVIFHRNTILSMYKQKYNRIEEIKFKYINEMENLNM